MTGATGALVSLGARERHRFFLVLAMGKWNQLHCSSEAPGLEATGKKGSPFQPGLDVSDVSSESLLAVLDKCSFAPKAF